MSEDPGFLLHIEGREYDATDLTLDEVEEIEDACGDISLENLDIGRAKVLKAIVFTLLKRDDPDVTMERVGQIRLRALLRGEPDDGAAVVASGSEHTG